MDDLIQTMYDAPGVGLYGQPDRGAAAGVRVRHRRRGPQHIINPRIAESSGEWTYDEGCLSVPGLNWPIVRPHTVHLVGIDLEGNDVSIEADTFEARCFQHEIDHLDGVLLIERLDEEQRREARRDCSGPSPFASGRAERRGAPNGCRSGTAARSVRDVIRLAFLGTPSVAVPALQKLVADGHRIALVVSRPDRRRGRGASTSPSPVKEAALRLGLEVSDRLADVTDSGAELGVVVAYGRIVPEPVLNRAPMLNLHFSLLPRWRGAAPVERAILAGDAVTGVCVMRLEAGLDTGPVYARQAVEIGPDESAADLSTRLATVGSDLLVEVLRTVRDGGTAALPQPEPPHKAGEATYAAKIEPADRELHWTDAAGQLARVVRIGGALTTLQGRRLVLRASPALRPRCPGTTPRLARRHRGGNRRRGWLQL